MDKGGMSDTISVCRGETLQKGRTMTDYKYVSESPLDDVRWTIKQPADNPMEEDELEKEVDGDFRLVDEAVLGRRGPDQEILARYGLKVLATLIRKNSDYGSSAWESPMLCPHLSAREGIQCRISDKVQRLVTLLHGKSAMVQESLEDTFRDLVGYGILWLACPEDDDCDE